jgi:hypothetical protein
MGVNGQSKYGQAIWKRSTDQEYDVTMTRPDSVFGPITNLNFDSSKRGHVQFLRYGEGCTFLELPARLPDTDTVINHAYVLVHRVNAAELPDDGKLEVPDGS